MRHYIMAVLALLLISAVAVVAQYTEATRYQYATPRVAYYPTSMCTMVDADQMSDTCYQDAVALCARVNTGYCFQNCAQHARNICFNSRRMPLITPYEGWEKQFNTRRDCQEAVVNMCRLTTTATQYNDCARRGYTRCSYIGRMFV